MYITIFSDVLSPKNKLQKVKKIRIEAKNKIYVIEERLQKVFDCPSDLPSFADKNKSIALVGFQVFENQLINKLSSFEMVLYYHKPRLKSLIK